MIKIKNSIRIGILIVLACIGFVLGMVWFFVWKANEIPAQIIGSIFGVIVSAIVTMLLLSAQTTSEEEHEVSGKVFDQKTDAYLKVLESLESIISDGKVDTIRDNRLSDGSVKDEFSQLLFGLTRLSSFVENKDSGKNGMNGFIKTITKIVKATTSEETRLPKTKDFWNGSGLKNPNEVQIKYYSELAECLEEVSRFAAKNIRRGTDESNLNLKELVENSGLFQEEYALQYAEQNSSLLPQGAPKSETVQAESSVQDYRIGCIADFLKEAEKQLEAAFGKENVERAGNGGDDVYWGRWTDGATPEAIADWLLDRRRRSYIGYKVNVGNGFAAEFILPGDAMGIRVDILALDKELKLAIEKHDAIKEKFGLDGYGWDIPDNFGEGGWILSGIYGGDYNGSSCWFDFRNASMEEAEYKAAYKKFRDNAILGIISGRGDSIKKVTEELKAFIQG